MSSRQHLTTRRGFIATLGFGGVALYGAWAAYGAAPIPFVQRAGAAMPPPHGDVAQGHGGGGGVMTPEEFTRRHEEFLARFGRPDGSVVLAAQDAPVAGPPASQPMAGDHAMHGAAPAAPQPMAGGHGMPAAPAPMPHAGQPGGHGGHAMPAMPPAADHAPAAMHADAGSEVLDIYLLAYRFGFSPDELHLQAGRHYRFRMMASDITHGASLQLGRASRIIRLRPNVVSEHGITFSRPGPVLVYCTVYCGPAHDAMKGRIVVA